MQTPKAARRASAKNGAGQSVSDAAVIDPSNPIPDRAARVRNDQRYTNVPSWDYHPFTPYVDNPRLPPSAWKR